VRSKFYIILEAVDNFGWKIPDLSLMVNPVTQSDSNQKSNLTGVRAHPGQNQKELIT
jgi:hypothetical protein